jgi:hypothetical protein
MIIEVESEWRATEIACPKCGGMLYTDGKHHPTCADEQCLYQPSISYMWEWLITLPEYRDALRLEWAKKLQA